MKGKTAGLILLAVWVMMSIACQTVLSSGDSQPQTRPTATIEAINPEAQQSLPTPMAYDFVRDGNPVPVPGEPISPETASQIVELARLGEGWILETVTSQDGETIFARKDLNVSAWDAASQELLWQVEFPDGVCAMAINEATATVVVGDALGYIWMLDAATGEAQVRWPANAGGADDIVISEDGQWLASRWGQEISVWRLPEIELVQFVADENYSAMAISNNRLWAAGNLYDLETGDLFWDGSDAHVSGVFPEAQWFLTSTEGEWVLRDIETGEDLKHFDLEGEYYTEPVALSPDHRKLAAAGYASPFIGAVWDVGSGELIDTVEISRDLDLNWESYCYGDGGGPDEIYGVEFSEDGQTVEIVTGYEETIYWDTESGQVWTALPTRMALPQSGFNGYPVLFAPNGKWLLSGEMAWDLASGEPIRFEGQTLVGFSMDNDRLYAYQDKAILEYTAPDFELAQQYPLGEESRGRCSFEKRMAPDGSLFFEGGYYGGDSYASFVWGLTREVPDFVESVQYDLTRSVLFSADGQRMLVLEDNWYDDDYVADVFDLQSGKKLATLAYPDGFSPLFIGMGLSQDGNTLAVKYADSIEVWDLRKPSEGPVHLLSPDGYFWDESIVVSPNGSLVAAILDDGIGIWDVSRQTIAGIVKLSVANAYIYDMAFSPDGLYLAVYASDGAVHLYGAPPAQ